MEYRWNAEKDAWLAQERGITFAELIEAIENGALLEDREHSQAGRGNQRMFWVSCKSLVWVIPYVMEGENVHFLKTAYPSRKIARHVRERGADEKA